VPEFVETPSTPRTPSVTPEKELSSAEVHSEPSHVNINDVLCTLESLQHFLTSFSASKDTPIPKDVACKLVELMKSMGREDASLDKRVFFTPASGKVMGHITKQFMTSTVSYVSRPYATYEEYVSIGNSLVGFLDCTSHSNSEREDYHFRKNYYLDEDQPLCQSNNWLANRKLRSNFIIMTCLPFSFNKELQETFEVDKQNSLNLFKYLTSPVHLAFPLDTIEENWSSEETR